NVDLAAQCADAFAHPAQPAAFGGSRPAAVVLDFEGVDIIAGAHADPTHVRARMPDDVGDRLAEGEGEDRFAAVGPAGGRRLDVDLGADAGGPEQRARAGDLILEGGTVTTDRVAHLAQCLPRDALDVPHLARRARRVAFDQLGCE